MDIIPVLNCFNGHMTVTHKKMIHLVQTGKCTIVRGPDGTETGLEWVYGGYDASQPGSTPTRHERNAKPQTVQEPIFGDFSDAEPGMPILQFWTNQANRAGVICSQ